MDREGYVSIDKQLDHLNTMRVQSVETVSSLGIMKSRPLKDLVVPSIYKTGASTVNTEQRLLFGDVGQLQLSLEAEGSTAESAATVSKIPTGTGSSTLYTQQCSKTVRKTVTHTKEGPVEKVEVIGGGPGCENLGKLGITNQDIVAAARNGKDLSRDGLKITLTGGDERSITTFNPGTDELGGFGGDFFKGLGTNSQKSTSTSSSSSSTKTVLADGTKTSTKTTFSSDIDFGDDLGAFMRGDVEEDLPDIHARSLKSRDERKDGFVGEGTLE